MTKEKYKEALQTKEWRTKRLSILRRDNYTCQHCTAKADLHVHHKWYIPGTMPWEVPDNYLVTLCETCHAKEHAGKNISSFIKKNKKVTPKKNKPADKENSKEKRAAKNYMKVKFMIRDSLTKDEKLWLKSNGIKISIGILKLKELTELRIRLKEKLAPVKNKIYNVLKDALK